MLSAVARPDGGDSLYAAPGSVQQRYGKRRASPAGSDGAINTYDRLHDPARAADIGNRRLPTDPLPHPCVTRSPSPTGSVSSVSSVSSVASTMEPTVLQQLSTGITLTANTAYHTTPQNLYADARSAPLPADHATAPMESPPRTRARYGVPTRLRQQEPCVLAQQPYFHGDIDRAEAENRLRQFCLMTDVAAAVDGTFLVREKRSAGGSMNHVITLVFRCSRTSRVMVEHHMAERARRMDGCEGNHFIVDGKVRVTGSRSVVTLVATLIADPNAVHATAIAGQARSTPLLTVPCPRPQPL